MIDLETPQFLQSAEGEIHFKKLKHNNDLIALLEHSRGCLPQKRQQVFGPQHTFKLSGSPQIGSEQGQVP